MIGLRCSTGIRRYDSPSVRRASRCSILTLYREVYVPGQSERVNFYAVDTTVLALGAAKALNIATPNRITPAHRLLTNLSVLSAY
jgi:hypothetical protein